MTFRNAHDVAFGPINGETGQVGFSTNISDYPDLSGTRVAQWSV